MCICRIIYPIKYSLFSLANFHIAAAKVLMARSVAHLVFKTNETCIPSFSIESIAGINFGAYSAVGILVIKQSKENKIIKRSQHFRNLFYSKFAKESDMPPKVAGKAKRAATNSKKRPAKEPSESEGSSHSDADESDEEERPPKKQQKGKEDTTSKNKKTEDKPLLNRTSSDFNSQDFSSIAKTSDGKTWNFKIATWNVDGIRSWVKKGGLEYLDYEKPDILCLQETKCSEAKLPPEVKNVKGYHQLWLSAKTEGYSGVSVYSKVKPKDVKYGIGAKEFDDEGRVITAEYDKFFLVTAYVPNAGRGLVTLPKRMEWDPVFQAYLKDLDQKKPVVLCGDLNVSHQEIDLANPKTNKRNAGFTQEERDGFSELLENGFIDSFRYKYPDRTGAYTFWSYMRNARSKNIGWRLDYFVVSERLMPQVCDVLIRDQVFGSDHCPLVMLLHI